MMDRSFPFPVPARQFTKVGMKAILASVILGGAILGMVGCESDVPPSRKVERGLTGQGALVQPDRSEDPIIRENTRVGY